MYKNYKGAASSMQRVSNLDTNLLPVSVVDIGFGAGSALKKSKPMLDPTKTVLGEMQKQLSQR